MPAVLFPSYRPQTLEGEADVRVVLQRRFDMATWFRRNGFPVDMIIKVRR